MTVPAMIRPATGGTKETLPGTCLPLAFTLLSAVVGEHADGLMGISFEYTTFKDKMPRFFSYRRITLASGQTEVL